MAQARRASSLRSKTAVGRSPHCAVLDPGPSLPSVLVLPGDYLHGARERLIIEVAEKKLAEGA